MIFTADQLVAHAVGDYILQSDWMADNKTKSHVAAAVHAVTYTLPFLFITWSLPTLAAICGTHFLIDRYRLARFVVWLKNGPVIFRHSGNYTSRPDFADGSRDVAWKPVTATGYPETKPPFLAVWLLIIADNILHVLCNGLAIFYFG